jgi:3-hydroxyacyl-[acyl-carrier-protein] dehydratase
MAQTAGTDLKTSKPFPGSAKSVAPKDEAHLREALKRCSASTYEAACRFRQTGDPDCLPTIILGVIEHHVDPDLRAKLKEADDDLRLIEDLGIDSLTMMEIVALAEDVLPVSINSEELCLLRTLGDVRQFIQRKVHGSPLPKPTPLLMAGQVSAEGAQRFS